MRPRLRRPPPSSRDVLVGRVPDLPRVPVPPDGGTFGIAPPSARLPDGRWSFAAVNLTGLTSTPTATYDPAATLRVRIQLPATESRLSKTVRRWRSDAKEKIVDEGSQSIHEGEITLEMKPQELMIVLEGK